MCDITANITSTGDAQISCTASGLPITISDEYGMWCALMCGREEIIAAHNELKKVCDHMATYFERDDFKTSDFDSVFYSYLESKNAH